MKEANMPAKSKILTISNDSALLKFLRQGLNGGNYELATTQQTGVALKDVVDRELPDFIILDIMMPHLDGIGVCLHLRQWTQTPIMMLSTWGTADGMVRGLNLSSDSYLTEPFGFNEVKRRVNDTLNRSTIAMKDQLTNIHNSTG
jgi:DNA-binding response OmpR family regulator